MKDRILKHLIENGEITSWEAIKEYGCTRLSEYIRQLRQKHIIESKWEKTINRYGDKIKYTRYILKEEENVSI